MELNRTLEAIEEEESDLHDLPDERLEFDECVPTLQQIACHEGALNLWHHYIACHKSTEKVREKTDDHLRIAYGLDENYRNESDKLVTLLNAPRRIQEMLKKSLDKIRVEMETWIRYFKEKIFKNGMMKYCVRDFKPNFCVWFQSDEIDYKKTASKMLSDAELIHVQKFVVMCLYGMADDIKRFPMSTLPDYFHRRGFFDFEISYWIPHFRIEVTTLLLELVSVISGEEDTKIDVIMASLCANRSYPFAFEYFWNRLDEADQISVALRVLPQTWQLQKTILSKMSFYQQRELMSEIPIALMENFLIKLDMPEYAFKVWLRVKDEIIQGEFASFVRQVYDQSISSENCICVLIDIWDTASDRLKNYAAQTQVGNIFDAFLFNEQRTQSSSKFLCRFLSLTSARTRKQLILDDADLLAKYIDNPNFMVDILELCLPNDSEKMEFKSFVMESFIMRENCVKLINALEFDKLNQKLAFYSSNDSLTRELMRELLKSQEIDANIFMLDYDKWDKLSNFILEIFTNDSSTGSELKKHLISSFSYHAIYYWNKSDDFNEMVKVVEQELSPLELESYKQTVLKHFQKGIITSKQFWRYFDANCFNTFVSWCLGDEKKVLDFKMLIPVDKVFDDVFGSIRGWYEINRTEYEPHHLLNELNAFLRCFCVGREEVKKYKIRKFNELNECLFRESWIDSGDRAWYNVLMWFFENDQEEILKVQSNDSKDTRKRRRLDLMRCFR